MKRTRLENRIALAIVAFSVGTAALHAENSNFAVGAKIGTLGGSIEATVGITEWLNFRGGANYLDFSTDDTYDDIDYDVDVNFESFMAGLDWHPFKNGFRITAALLSNGNEATLKGTPTEPQTIGDTVYPPEVIGTITGDMEFDDIAPYFGIGFGNAVGVDSRVTFVFDLGVVVQTYDLTLSSDSPAVILVPGFAEDLKEEEAQIEDDLNEYEVYPVLAFGIAYQF